jgi:hypothetical protein
MAVTKEQLAGTFVLGAFRGVSQDQYPKLHVGTFVRQDGTEYEERMEFNPFDPKTGAATLPEGLELGTRVAVRISLSARGYTDKNGDAKTFISKRALEVTPI